MRQSSRGEFTICIWHDNVYPFFQVESSPGPISPSEERHNLSSGSGNSSAGGSAHLLTTAQTANNMPLSDNNVSTTNMALSNTWDINAADAPEQDINVSVVFDLSQRQNSSRGAAFS